MKLFNPFSKKKHSSPSNKNKFEDIIARSLNEQKNNNTFHYDIKVNTITIYQEEVKQWPDKEKIDFILHNISKVQKYKASNDYLNDHKRSLAYMREGYIKQLFKNKLIMEESDIIRLIQSFRNNKKLDWSNLSTWPLSHMLNQIYSQYKKQDITNELSEALQKLKKQINGLEEYYHGKEKAKWVSKIDNIIYGESAEGIVDFKPEIFLGKDDFSEYANKIIKTQSEENKKLWYQLLSIAQKASGSKPSKKYLNDSKQLITKLGNEKFKKTVTDWFIFIINLKEKEEVHVERYNGQEYSFSTYEFISSTNTDAIKGFVWMCSHFHSKQTISTVAQLAERSFKKIPGRGPAAAAIGNACLYVLYKSKGLDGIGQLSRLKLRIKQSSTLKLIDKYLFEAAKEQGVSISEIEDLSVDDFGLINGKKEITFDDYTAVIQIEKIGKTKLEWLKPDGTEQKTIPKIVKEKHKAKLKKVKDSIKQINQSTSAQKDRIDRMFKTNRSWTWENFEQLFFNHGLMGFLTKKILWNFQKDSKNITVIYQNNNWKDINGNIVPTEAIEKVSLWHPIQAKIHEIESWRELITEQKIQQPIKQAFREVYLLTDAEINTKTYSNRMAAHILKQHQFNSLAKARNWSYSLLGAFDNGIYNDLASIKIPEYKLKAEFWINEVNADDEFNDTGIWNYIATDQVRFIDTNTDNTIDLLDVPDIILSEILRDVDLFVGVASIGNDPTWQDSGGVPRYNDYWQSYSFGDLSEIAKTRKAILEKLVPRLKINKVASIKDKFLIVKGKLRTYKIHIGSTNILMEPNDQYLCIVPDRSKNSKNDLFLPFEGDAGLSVIISKAFLLAEDDKISDSTITSQINRK